MTSRTEKILTAEELEQKIKEARNAYFREYRREHKDKVKEYNRRYWENRVQKLEAEKNK